MRSKIFERAIEIFALNDVRVRLTLVKDDIFIEFIGIRVTSRNITSDSVALCAFNFVLYYGHHLQTHVQANEKPTLSTNEPVNSQFINKFNFF